MKKMSVRYDAITRAVCIGFFVCLVWGVAIAASATQPNVIFILADDLGWAELGCYGNTFNETPHIDQLAHQGLRFTDAYAAAPVCSPYRASLMTGQWPARVGITDYLRANDPKHLGTEHVTLAEAFKRAGYATGIIGKWHLSGYQNEGAEEFPPSVHGFDETIVSENRGIGGGSYFHPYHFNTEIGKRLPGTEHLVDRCNLEAVEFIERHKNGPFFLYLSHYAVHTRLAGKQELVAKYEHKPGAGKGDRAEKNNPHLAAQLESIDEGVGLIMKKLEALGLSDNTILIFTSDNGGESRVTSNKPLRAGKSTLYEGGIREPLIVRWPAIIPANKVSSQIVSSVDYYPTLVAAIGSKLDPKQKMDGISLLPIWQEPSRRLERDTIYWHYPLAKDHFLGGKSGGALRSGKWKLKEDFNTEQLELYNLEDDLGEAHDLAGEMPAKVKELHKLLKDWRTETGAVVISVKAGRASPQRMLPITGKYLLLPISNNNPQRSQLQVKVGDVLIHSLDVDFAPTPDAIDWWAYLDTAEYVGKTAELFASPAPAVLDLIKTGDTLLNLQPLYDEALRPQLRFSQMRGWNNDPNGLTYYDGEYHLFWQSNPAGSKWANMYWGHAVSKDLVHWEELPHAIRPQGGRLEAAKKHPAMIIAKAFSGAGNVDLLNTAGFQTGQEKPIILVYTDYGGDGEGLAYSNDRGRTWSCYAKNPIIPKTRELGGNDSKLVWYEPGKHWVLVHFTTSGFRGLTFFTSPDLKTWTRTCQLPDFWECPELFEIPVDGDPANTRWILWAGDTKYLIGTFDGKTYTPESTVKKQLHWGSYYASQCFTRAPNGRVIQVGWTRKIDMPGMPFNQAFSVPAELSLRTTESGLHLCAMPVKELETLRMPNPIIRAGKELQPTEPTISCRVGEQSQLFDIVLTVKKGSANRMVLMFGGNEICYDFKAQKLEGIFLPLKNGIVVIRLLIDRPLYEVFGTGGRCHKVASRGEAAGKPVGNISVTAEGGSATVVSLEVHEMKSIWK